MSDTIRPQDITPDTDPDAVADAVRDAANADDPVLVEELIDASLDAGQNAPDDEHGEAAFEAVEAMEDRESEFEDDVLGGLL